MVFSFGASTSQPAQPQQNMFGAANTQAKPAASNPFGNFGTQPAQPSTSTSLFGQPQAQQGQQQQPQGSTPLFGGQASGTGGTFGSTQPQAGQQQQQTGLFGSTTNQQSGTNTGGTGLFGSSANQNGTTGGGLFGSTNQNTGGGLFGSTAQQQQQQQQGGGLFGSTNNNAGQNQGTGSMFGNTQQNQGQGQGQGQGMVSSMFGNPAGSSMFGQPQQQQPQQQQQQQQQQHPLGQSTLWQSTIGGGAPEPDIETRMMAVKNAWDPNSADYRFKTFVYNVVDQGTTHQYGRQGLNDELWTMASRENPDPTTRVPVAVNGPQDLQKRRQKQIEMAAMQQHISKEVSAALRHTRQKAWATDARTRNLQARQTNLHDRLSRLVFQIDQALPPEGSADASTTADIIQKLESSKSELEGGSLKSRAGKESLRAQVNTLRGRIAELRRYPIKQDTGEAGWLADPEAQAQVAEILSQHQLALEGLTGLLNRMEFDEGVISKGLTELGEARH